MTTECYGICRQQIEWKTGPKGKKQRFNLDSTTHYCKECQYCERDIEWRDNQYVNVDDKQKHSCEEYFAAQNKDVKEIEQTGKLVTGGTNAPSHTMTVRAEPSKPTTKTAFEIQQDQKTEDIKRLPAENIETQQVTQEIAKNLGITLGELVVAINSGTESMIAYNETIRTLIEALIRRG